MQQLEIDLIKELLKTGTISSPCLELGVSYDFDFNLKSELEKVGIEYYGTDLHSGKDVDFVLDFESDFEQLANTIGEKKTFKTIIILNVLEHTFQPIKVLENAVKLLEPGGVIVISTPTIWPIHNYPVDTYRLLPDFYTQFALRNDLVLENEYFRFLGHGKISDFTLNNQIRYPSPWPGKFSKWRSKIIQTVFNTYGRSMISPSHLSISVVMKKQY